MKILQQKKQPVKICFLSHSLTLNITIAFGRAKKSLEQDEIWCQARRDARAQFQTGSLHQAKVEVECQN